MSSKQSKHFATLLEMKAAIEARNPHNYPLKKSFKTYQAYMKAAQQWQVERANIIRIIQLTEARFKLKPK